jgi:hypothetical protein
VQAAVVEVLVREQSEQAVQAVAVMVSHQVQVEVAVQTQVRAVVQQARAAAIKVAQAVRVLSFLNTLIPAR